MDRIESIDNGRRPPHHGDMEARLTAVEADVREIKGILQRLEPAIGSMAAKVDRTTIELAELKGRVSQLPTTIQLLGFVLAVMAAGGLLKYFLP
jgi:hypothetical protein